MSIQSQIDRINAVKARIGTNLVTQGVTVQPNAMLEEMAEQILSVGGKVTTEVHEVTFASDLGNGTNTDKAILTGNAFVKENYAKNGFAAMLIPVTPHPMTAASVSHGFYHGNLNIGASDAARYGFQYSSNSATNLGFLGMTAKISATNYNTCFRARSNGNLNIYVASNRRLPAGTYTLILLCWED